jgi:hypothetical protein
MMNRHPDVIQACREVNRLIRDLEDRGVVQNHEEACLRVSMILRFESYKEMYQSCMNAVRAKIVLERIREHDGQSRTAKIPD